jgi:hypothetical protein
MFGRLAVSAANPNVPPSETATVPRFHRGMLGFTLFTPTYACWLATSNTKTQDINNS